jgi:hypothetical protein
LSEFLYIPRIPADWGKVVVRGKAVGTQKQNYASMLLELRVERYFGIPPQLRRKALLTRFYNAAV